MEAQIEQAVAAAMNPQVDVTLKNQAIEFLDQVKQSPEGWDLCIALFVRQPRSSQEARMFALQVVVEVLSPLKYSILSESSRQSIQRTFMEYINQEYVQVSTTTDPPYIRNKFAHALTLLFVHTYTTSWPSFFQDLLSLIHTNVPPSDPTGKTNLAAVDLLLRVLLSIDSEVADVIIPRGTAEIKRNNTIKDAIREADVKSLASTWYELMIEYQEKNLDIVETCLKVVAQYVVWIDISLIVNESYIPLLFQFLQVHALRSAACDVLIEIVAKGMPPEDKYKLINFLNLSAIIPKLNFIGDEDFTERVSKLVNMAGQSLVSAYVQVAEDAKSTIYSSIEQFLPFMLRFLADKYDDISSTVFGFATDYIGLLKKPRTNKQSYIPLLDSQREFLATFLDIITRKLEYDEDWEEEPDPDDVAMFSDFRRKLKAFHDSVYVIDPDLFTRYTQNLIHETLAKYIKCGPSGVKWTEAELSLYLLYTYAEVIKSPPVFFNGPEKNQVPTPLAELIQATVESNISRYPGDLIAAQYFEMITRYYQFFEYRPDLIPLVLESFLDQRGCHHPKDSHRARVWYLFQRFIKTTRSRLKSYEEQILHSLEDLLVIRAVLPEPDPAGEEMVNASAINYGLFDSQLYLFETVGMLVSTDLDATKKRIDLLLLVLNPLVNSIQQSLQPGNFKPDDRLFVLQIHHVIMAIGNIVKGFRTFTEKRLDGIPTWAEAFKHAAEVIMSALEALKQYEIIRDAVRFSFARFVSSVGAPIVPLVPSLINGLLSDCKPNELTDFLPFLSLMIHKFKTQIVPMINDLFLPLVNRIFLTLGQPATGTDDVTMQSDLKKAYLTFIYSLFSYNIESILVSDVNRPHVEGLIQNIFSYAMDTSDGSTEKIAFSLVTKMVQAWGSGTSKSQMKANGINQKGQKDGFSGVQSGSPSPLPGFDRLIYELLVPMSFEIPMKPTFNIQDAESQLVLTEIAILQKAIYDKQGEEVLNFLSTVYFPRINCPPELGQEYISNMQNLEGKNFKTFFVKFIRQSRGLK